MIGALPPPSKPTTVGYETAATPTSLKQFKPTTKIQLVSNSMNLVISRLLATRFGAPCWPNDKNAGFWHVGLVGSFFF